ncbi:uncharacterized protein Dan [Polyergus mexicanus]|uniref:uncharacterized protein Dan n=1 Tax=Polyergus mexicanus TaxID=615972 RepID=UPI0038B64898
MRDRRQQYSDSRDSRHKNIDFPTSSQDLLGYEDRRETSPNNIVAHGSKLNNSAMPRNETPQRTAGKRPLRALTPQEKLDAIRRVHEGESKASVARDIGVPESTLRGWCKAEHKIVNQVNTMKSSGSFERLSSPSESDRSTPGSSSRPPSANLTSGPSTSGGKESSGGTLEEVESGSPAKRMKVENDAPSTSEPSITSYYGHNLITSYLYTLMNAQPALKSALLEQQLINNKALLSNALIDGGFSSSGYSTSNASLGNVSMMGGNAMSSAMSAQRDVNGKKTRHRVNMSTSIGNTFARCSSSKKHNLTSSPIERENNLISIPSTSSGIVNGNHVVGPTMSKPLQDGKHINDIAQQLLLQQQLKQQQSINFNSDLLTQWVNRFEPAMRNILDERPVPSNSVNNNNNNIHKNNNQVENRKANSILPPGIHEAADHGAKFVTWLRKHGSIFTFQQVKPVETIVEQIVAWAKPREIKSDDKSNSMS